jgi:hypothetical protein
MFSLIQAFPFHSLYCKLKAWQGLEYFKEVNLGKSFTLPNCWKEIQGCPNFEEVYEAYKASLLGSKTAKDAKVNDLDAAQSYENTTSRAS